mgnify:CR=1 FL=1
MMNSSDLTKKLENFGLNRKQAKVYLTLLNRDLLTPVELARESKLNRTTIYRVLEELNNIGLVEEILDQHRFKARAVSPERLDILIAKEESKLEEKRKKLPKLVSELSVLNHQPSGSTQVKYFRGKNGLQQMLWNTLKTQSELVGYGYADWNDGVGKEFAEKLRKEVVKRKIKSREIQNNNQFLKMSEWTKVEDYNRFYECRFILKSVVDINHDTYIYDGVFAFYHLFEGDLFGVEIHNKEIAKTQRQIFEVLWKQSKKML